MVPGSDPGPILCAGHEGHGPSAPRVLGRRGQGQQQVGRPVLRMPQTFSLAFLHIKVSFLHFSNLH